MRKYKSAIYKHLHGEFKDFLKDGMITQERMDEFERDCFKETPDAPRAPHAPALSAASPAPRAAAQTSTST
jgi:hypothetical protein